MKKLHDASSAKYHNKAITLKCIVSGKSLSPYCIPKVISVICDANEPCCKVCPYRADKILNVVPKDENILKFLDSSSSQLYHIIKEVFSLNCDFTFKVTAMQNVERLYIIPTTTRERSKSKMAPVAYYIGHGLDINTTYNMTGYTTVNPRNQSATHVFTSAEKLQSDIQSFSLAKRAHKLEQFHVAKPSAEKLFSYLEDLYETYASGITKIYDRFDLHLAVDLVYRSTLAFKFDTEIVHKGWMDVMIIGDTRCGKGYVAEKLMNFFKLGEVISGDNCSLAGLIGGLQQYDKHWIISWGKIPLNDGGLVIIDEAGEIGAEEWAKLSRVRSEGVAEITKIQTQVTAARTRLLFLANPPQKAISNYSYGIQSLTEVIRTPEDIARFDFALVVAHDEVAIADINKHWDDIPARHSAEDERDLILWTWSRMPEQVKFSPRATKLVYSLAISLAKQYTFSIPLIQGENVRVKLAKLAIAFASRFFSSTDNHESLYVQSIHVECAYHFLTIIYKKECCGYYALSQLYKVNDLDMSDRDFTLIDKYFVSFGHQHYDICKCLLSNNNITQYDIAEHVNVDIVIAREMISKMLKQSCIIKHDSHYIKTPSFTRYLKKIVLK